MKTLKEAGKFLIAVVALMTFPVWFSALIIWGGVAAMRDLIFDES